MVSPLILNSPGNNDRRRRHTVEKVRRRRRRRRRQEQGRWHRPPLPLLLRSAPSGSTGKPRGVRDDARRVRRPLAVGSWSSVRRWVVHDGNRLVVGMMDGDPTFLGRTTSPTTGRTSRAWDDDGGGDDDDDDDDEEKDGGRQNGGTDRGGGVLRDIPRKGGVAARSLSLLDSLLPSAHTRIDPPIDVPAVQVPLRPAPDAHGRGGCREVVRCDIRGGGRHESRRRALRQSHGRVGRGGIGWVGSR
jgi:hypothetical protein